jgi:hypothetical protein
MVEDYVVDFKNLIFTLFLVVLIKFFNFYSFFYSLSSKYISKGFRTQIKAVSIYYRYRDENKYHTF